MRPVATAPHRVLLFDYIEAALRAEHGVRTRQAQGKKTDYYAGRRAGFISAAARLMNRLYGGDYELAKRTLVTSVRYAGGQLPPEDLVNPYVAEPLARDIAETALKVI